MRDLTIVLPHFMNLGMLEEQQRIWASYPEELRKRLHVIVVDDCSPEADRPTASHFWIEGLGSIRCFRLLSKRRWNWLACRNLGALKACTDWLLLTDIDHGVPVETLTHLLTDRLEERAAYRFKRLVAPRVWPYRLRDCASWKPHNDTWLLTRQLFYFDDGEDQFVGGYDERLSGCYGTSGEFRDRVQQCASAVVLRDDVILRYPREVIADASTLPTVYARKNDPDNDADLARRKAARATLGRWRPVHGLTPFEAVPLLLPVAK